MRGGLPALAAWAPVAALACGPGRPPPAQPTPARLVYPETRRDESIVDDYHGTKVADPYRWLEAADSAETRAWVEAQNRLTFGYLERIPERAQVRKRIERLYDFARRRDVRMEGGRVFYQYNDGLQDQWVLYVADGPGAEGRVLLDPNTLSPDGTVALEDWVPSEDGKLLAYSLSSAGSDWAEWRVREIDSGKDRPDRINWCKWVPVAWTHDGLGFYYARYPEPKGDALKETNYFHKLYYHRLGTQQEEDILVHEYPDQKTWYVAPQISDDGRYLFVYTWKGTGDENQIAYLDLETKGSTLVELVTGWDGAFTLVGNDGPVFYFRTTLSAPRGRVIAIDARRPERQRWKELVRQSDATLQRVSLFGDRFVAKYIVHATSRVRLFALDGTAAGEVPLPGLGDVDGFHGDRDDEVAYFTYTSWTTPAHVWRWDAKTGATTLEWSPKLNFDPAAYEVKQIFYVSGDGTRVPMFLAYAKETFALDGRRPTFLYGYGGFNHALTPYYHPVYMAWMQLGGVLAIPNIRGGGEYGEEWHKAGTKERKQNVFDDFIAAAEWLITNGYTTRPRLAAAGASNGGLLVAACMTQRPDLFGVVFPEVGVLDMLRFHKFTIGHAWIDDYGSSDDPDGFRYLYAYSPYHNLEPNESYPATMIITADHDDRVVPAHSYKFAAALQHAQRGPSPILIRIETRAGHGSTTPIYKKIHAAADQVSFALEIMGTAGTGGTGDTLRP